MNAELQGIMESPKLKKEMSYIERLGLEKHIDIWLQEHSDSYLSGEDKFGLPFTSHSDSYAALWNENFSGEIEGKKLVGFTLTETQVPTIILEDDGKHLYYEF